jgi:redox-sensitive bicupin YhaK (pirin superfamily)
MHPHRDMEIVTYVLDGQLEHRDNQGNRGVIEPGEVQVMSAGKGITHSEYNHSQEKPVHFLQLWILPRTRGLPPRWEQRKFAPDARRGKLLPIVTPTDHADESSTLHIDQDASIYVASLDAGQSVTHTQLADRHAYMFVMDGNVNVNGKELSAGDQARIASEPKLDLRATKDAHVMLLDLP